MFKPPKILDVFLTPKVSFSSLPPPLGLIIFGCNAMNWGSFLLVSTTKQFSRSLMH